MRIARFTTGGDPQFGVVTGDVDDDGIPDDDCRVVALAGDPLHVGINLLDEEHKLDDVRLLAPVLPRSKVVGIGRNYAAHAAELGHDLPSEPLMFLKPNTSVVGPGDPVFYPRQSSEVHYEGELAVVISRICRDVPAERARDVIWGYTVANDVTARDLQRSDVQFTRAKGFDSFCPLGPWIETELTTDDLRVRTHLNGDLKQDGSTKDMIFDVPTLVAHVSSVMTLLPGDVILTGTPEGVGPMEVGDEVDVTISGIGSLTNKVVARDCHPRRLERRRPGPRPVLPSPTGSPHVGLARTALFNWAFARHHGGTFVFRIEDTDAARDSQESYDTLLEVMRWLGFEWDEGPEVGGPYAPYRQSERFDLYADVAARLLEAGRAYHCFCSQEELEERNAAARAEGRTPGYDGHCRDLTDARARPIRVRGPQAGRALPHAR